MIKLQPCTQGLDTKNKPGVGQTPDNQKELRSANTQQLGRAQAKCSLYMKSQNHLGWKIPLRSSSPTIKHRIQSTQPRGLTPYGRHMSGWGHKTMQENDEKATQVTTDCQSYQVKCDKRSLWAILFQEVSTWQGSSWLQERGRPACAFLKLNFQDSSSNRQLGKNYTHFFKFLQDSKLHL